MSRIIILLIAISCVNLQSVDYNLDSDYLITDLKSSNKDCISKLEPVLKSLAVDDQYLLSKSLSSDDKDRCFDPDIHRQNFVENLTNLNTAYGLKVGKSTNTMIRSFECILTAAKKTLDEKSVEQIRQTLGDLTPRGYYPMYTYCLGNFILNVNYILAKRRRFLFSTIKNVDSVAIKSFDGKYQGFPYKIKERDIIVNEFTRLSNCINDFSVGKNSPVYRSLLHFANSEQCGFNPGKLDQLICPWCYYEGVENKPIEVVDPKPERPEPIIDETKPQILIDPPKEEVSVDSKTDSRDSSSSNTGADGSDAISNPDKTDKDPSGSTTYTVYDYCLGEDVVYTVDPKPAEENNNTQASSGSTGSASDKADNAVVGEGISIAKPFYYERRFCPAWIGTELYIWDQIKYNTPTLEVALKYNYDFQYTYDIISKCSTIKDVDGLKYIVTLQENFKDYQIQPSLLGYMKSFITDTSSNLDLVAQLIDDVSTKAYSKLNDFSLVCFNGVCSCPDCPTPIKSEYTFINQNRYEYSDSKMAYILPYYQTPEMFYINLTKCGNSILYVAIFSYNGWQNYIDIKFSSIPTKFTSVFTQYFNNYETCLMSNITNKPNLGCTSFPYSEFKDDCKVMLGNECKVTDIGNQIKQFKGSRLSIKECDFTNINFNNQGDLENYKESCFKWINSNLIKSTLSLDIDAIIQLPTTGKVSKNLRYLENIFDPVYYEKNNVVDDDLAANFDKEAQKGSDGGVNVDGSIDDYIIMDMTYQKVDAPMAPPTTDKAGIALTAAAANIKTNDSLGSNNSDTSNEGNSKNQRSNGPLLSGHNLKFEYFTLLLLLTYLII